VALLEGFKHGSAAASQLSSEGTAPTAKAARQQHAAQRLNGGSSALMALAQTRPPPPLLGLKPGPVTPEALLAAADRAAGLLPEAPALPLASLPGVLETLPTKRIV